MRYFESKPQVTFFLKDDAKQDQVKKIISELKHDEKVAATKYVSKEEALKIYRKQFEKDPLLLEMVTSSILPASIEVSTYRVEDLQMIFDAYKNHPAIEEIVFQKDIVENLSKWTRIVRVVGLSYIGFHLLLSFLVIMTIIGMKIALKREEIEIMQLLGASHSYIRTPFILEGMIYGFVGSLISNIFSAILILLMSNVYHGAFTPNASVVIIFMAAMTVFGMVLGWFSSFLSVLRFLK